MKSVCCLVLAVARNNGDVMLAVMTNEQALDVLRRTVARRELFHSVFTPAVLDEMENLFGVENRVFSFRQTDAGKYDPLDAMRCDTLRGAIALLRFEADGANLSKARALLAEAEAEVEKGSSITDHE